MRRSIHELSEAEKRQVADELMIGPGVFVALAVAALIIVGLLWTPDGLSNDISRVLPISIASRSP